MKFVLPIVAVIVVLAAVGAFLATRGSDEKATANPDTPVEGKTADSSGETQETTPQEDPNAPSIDKLKKFVAQDNPQAAFDEMRNLIVLNAASKDEIFTIISPILERLLKEERQLSFNDADSKWEYKVNQLKEERRRREEKEAAEREAKRKKEEEEERAEKERKRLEERANAIKEDKMQRIAKLHENALKHKLSSSIMDFQTPFEDEDEDLQKWRDSWKGIVDNASKLADAFLTFRVDTPSAIEIPVYTLYKVRRDAANENDNYTIISMKLLSFDGEKVTLGAQNADILQKIPQIQRRKYTSEKDGELSFSIDYHLLLPEQLMVLAKAALASKQDIDESSIPTLVASLLVIHGNFLSDVIDNELFDDFRSSTGFADTLKDELAFNKNSDLASKHLQMLEEMLNSCQKAPKTLKTRIFATTIRRYLASLLKSFPDSADDFKDFVEKYQEFDRNN